MAPLTRGPTRGLLRFHSLSLFRWHGQAGGRGCLRSLCYCFCFARSTWPVISLLLKLQIPQPWSEPVDSWFHRSSTGTGRRQQAPSRTLVLQIQKPIHVKMLLGRQCWFVVRECTILMGNMDGVASTVFMSRGVHIQIAELTLNKLGN